MLTRKQHELLCFINDRLGETGVSPSFEEMKEALALKSKSGVHRLISALEEPQLYSPPAQSRARAGDPAPADAVKAKPAGKAPPTPKLVPTAANDVLEIPLHGRIAAGLPIEAIEGRNMLSVPAALLGAGEHYALEVAGDSMVEAGILDGDYALVRKADTARDGEIVVALVDDAEATLKYFRREGSMIRLDPANRAYDPQRYRPNQIACRAASPACCGATDGRSGMAAPRIDFIELPCADLEATRAFYARSFGWDFTAFGPSYACTLSGDVDLGLQADRAEATTAALPVVNVPDLEAALAAVEAAGGTITHPIFAYPGGRRFHFRDPAGNELAAHRPD